MDPDYERICRGLPRLRYAWDWFVGCTFSLPDGRSMYVSQALTYEQGKALVELGAALEIGAVVIGWMLHLTRGCRLLNEDIERELLVWMRSGGGYSWAKTGPLVKAMYCALEAHNAQQVALYG